ncbi:MAG: hypothetical protein JRE58_15265 [Deltaproteobacteria bacterium]|nr:hypothetical protein [Deltaproteobacteria bacterium]
MKTIKVLFGVAMIFLLAAPFATAGEFDWIRDFNIRAELDPSGFRARLAARFKIGDATINTVLGSTENQADAYMVCRLSEMSQQQTEHVLREYRSGKGKGWGAIAKRLGIKPGSSAFHALKNDQDLYDNHDKNNQELKGKEKGKEKGKKKKK